MGARGRASSGELAGRCAARSLRGGRLGSGVRGGERRRAATCAGAGAAGAPRWSARCVRKQLREAEREQPQKDDGKRRQREAGYQGDHVVVAVERPVPKQVVAEGESGNEDQRSAGHMHTLNGSGDGRGRGGSRRETAAYDRSR